MPFEPGAASPRSEGLEIDLRALFDNYHLLQKLVGPAQVAGVVKADAYGLGAQAVSRTLIRAGCRHLFVAHLGEALALSPALSAGVSLYVLNGLRPGTEAQAAEAGLVPVLNTLGQVAAWRDLAVSRGRPLAAVLNLDSGMTRLGLSAADLETVKRDAQIFQDLDVRYYMTHLARADVPEATSNADQVARFRRQAASLPSRPLSISNSAAALSRLAGADDLVRAGLALYGGAPVMGGRTPMRSVIRLTARVLQVRDVPAQVGVGYGLTHVTAGPTRIATIESGYADGWPRALGNRGDIFWRGRRLPIIGQISMDSMTVDATALQPDALREGDVVELIGPHQSLEAVAQAADTISYEILTRLGHRYRRTYTDRAAALTGSST